MRANRQGIRSHSKRKFLSLRPCIVYTCIPFNWKNCNRGQISTILMQIKIEQLEPHVMKIH